MNSEDPFFSIVIPAYNRASFLPTAIRSVLNQTRSDFELVIVDDGSTDNTADVVKSFGDNRIRYFYKQNEERSIARNFGISKCRGKYINFLDSDDYFYEHHLASAYKRLEVEGFPVALHTGFEIRDDQGKLIYTKTNFSANENKNLIRENIFLANSFFIKREIFSEISFLDSRDAVMSEDWYLWLKLASRYPIVTENVVTNVVIEHRNRSLNNLDPITVEKSILVIIENLRKDNRVTEFYGDQFNFFEARNWCFVALCFSLNKNLKKTQEYLKRARKIYPRIVLRKNYLAVLKKKIVLLFSQ